MAESVTSLAIGIDLGTTNSCVAAVRNGRVEIIPNDMGSRLTPSCVAFTDEERLIGDAAKAQAIFNPKNTVFDVKRLVGRKFEDGSVQNGIKYWPFTVLNHEENPKIEVEYKSERKTYTPEEISAMVLGKMKDTAETYLGCPVKDAVITVPAYFNDSQRQATIDAGKIAGLNVLSILNEPTAAAIAYGVGNKIQQKRHILIYDLGGGTFDAVVMTIENGVFDVQAVGGNTNLGGGDFDNLLVKHFAEEFQKKFQIDLLGDHRASGKLRKACEAAKRKLSSTSKETIQIESLCRGIDFTSSLSRGRMENICADLFNGTMEVVESVLKDSNLEKTQIHEVVLAGGSTRIPKIQNMLEKYFEGKKLNKTINPDEAVAYGAALHAAVLSRNSSVEEILLKDVTPLSLGIANHRGDMVTGVPRNTKIPTNKTKNWTTVNDYQTAIKFQVYEGERKIAKDNHLLGTFKLHNIEVALHRVPSIEVTFNIDSNGILHVTAQDRKTGSTNDITITTNKGRLQKEDIERMVVEAKQLQEDEREQRDRWKAQSALEAACHKAQAEVKYRVTAGRISSEGRSRVLQSCEEALAWVESSQDVNKVACEDKVQEMKNICATFGLQLNIDSDDSSDDDGN